MNLSFLADCARQSYFCLLTYCYVTNLVHFTIGFVLMLWIGGCAAYLPKLLDLVLRVGKLELWRSLRMAKPRLKLARAKPTLTQSFRLT
jgi:hypothetical protein